jgi:hypothetical protein
MGKITSLKESGLSPNSLSDRKLASVNCSVISGARKEIHIARNPKARISDLPWRGWLAIFETLFVPPPLRFAEGQQRDYEGQYPAEACRAICLSSRALARLSYNIRSTDLEMTLT